MGEQDVLFCLLDGLCGWAKMEFKRRGVHDLPSTIVAIESLIELKRSPLRDKATGPVVAIKVGEIGTSLSIGTNLLEARVKARKIKH